MTILVTGLIIFFALHFVPSMQGFKRSLMDRFGVNGYKGIFSVFALVALGLIIWGYSRADFQVVYDPPLWGRHVTMVLVLFAFICLAFFHLKGRIRKAIRHPMLCGIAFWAAGHLFSNGDLASVLLFGSFLVFSVIDIVIANAQGRINTFEPKSSHDVIGIGVGVAFYVIVMLLHPYIIGVPVIATGA